MPAEYCEQVLTFIRDVLTIQGHNAPLNSYQNVEDMVKKVELLAPAGNISCFYAAVQAGADAVYLAGEKFGARAYADNFTTEEVCEAIRYGHLFQVKTYLTLNTLIKEREFHELYPYIIPFYEAGLDGIIVQDFGVVRLLKKYFPGLEIHASTQMTVTGKDGAKLLKDYGVSRIVPARELSLEELCNIKKTTDIELEIFIHGAMCYAYSGQCLFSSVLGGRSGNRGRCAGPCRLPYQIYRDEEKLSKKGQDYPLSLKDLCTIQILPELIMAGMDSFKIEGRMKSAEYVAAVTAIYRKYIDHVYQMQNPDGSFESSILQKYHVAKEDLSLLQRLYVRTDLQDGYFHTHNGASLVTLQKPSYSTVADFELETVRKRYLSQKRKRSVCMEAMLIKGQSAKLTMRADFVSVTVTGDCVDAAINRAMTREDIVKQLSKLGNTPFEADEISLQMEDDIFIPNKALNELRRTAVDALMAKLAPGRSLNAMVQTYNNGDEEPVEKNKVSDDPNRFEKSCAYDIKPHLTVTVNTLEQLMVCQKSTVISSLFFTFDFVNVSLKKQGVETFLETIRSLRTEGIKCYLMLPRVMRKKTAELCDRLMEQFPEQTFDGVVTNSLEGLSLFQKKGMECIADAGLYCFNKEAADFLSEEGISTCTLPYECSYHEMKELITDKPQMLIIYSYLPLMESAGCVAKTMSDCRGSNLAYELKDRYQKKFHVVTHCDRCENTIYNTVPMNLMGEWEKIIKLSVDHRIDFTIESSHEVKQILQTYADLSSGSGSYMPKSEYTKGYFKRGVE